MQPKKLTILVGVFCIAETNHAQYYGKWYCPNITGQIPGEEWKAQQKALRAQRQQQQQQHQVCVFNI